MAAASQPTDTHAEREQKRAVETMTRSGRTPSGLEYSVTLRPDGRTAYMVFRPYAWTEAGSEATHAGAVEAVCEIVRKKEKQP